MHQILALSDEDFRMYIIKCFNEQSQIIMKQIKNRKHQSINRNYSLKTHGNYRTEKYSRITIQLSWMGHSRVKITGQNP